MPLQLCAPFLQYPILTGSWTAVAAPVIVPHQIISTFFAIVFEEEAVYLHWKLLCNNRTGDQLEPGLLAWALVDNPNDYTVWPKHVYAHGSASLQMPSQLFCSISLLVLGD